jgi:hypothetical protein
VFLILLASWGRDWVEKEVGEETLAVAVMVGTEGTAAL